MGIAKLPNERKIWMLRKFYGGNGGCLPPTDKRILCMTPEQIDLEFTHISIDKELSDKASGKTGYSDDEYDQYEASTDSDDRRLSDMPEFGSDIDPNYVKPKESDWEDVEIDDY